MMVLTEAGSSVSARTGEHHRPTHLSVCVEKQREGRDVKHAACYVSMCVQRSEMENIWNAIRPSYPWWFHFCPLFGDWFMLKFKKKNFCVFQLTWKLCCHPKTREWGSTRRRWLWKKKRQQKNKAKRRKNRKCDEECALLNHFCAF